MREDSGSYCSLFKRYRICLPCLPKQIGPCPFGLGRICLCFRPAKDLMPDPQRGCEFSIHLNFMSGKSPTNSKAMLRMLNLGQPSES